MAMSISKHTEVCFEIDIAIGALLREVCFEIDIAIGALLRVCMDVCRNIYNELYDLLGELSNILFRELKLEIPLYPFDICTS